MKLQKKFVIAIIVIFLGFKWTFWEKKTINFAPTGPSDNTMAPAATEGAYSSKKFPPNFITDEFIP